MTAIKDNVVCIEGSVDIGFIKQFNENLDAFLERISNIVKKYKNKIKIIPELGISKTIDQSFLKQWIEPMISSKVFKNIDLYGPEVSEGIEQCVYIFKLAEKYGLKKKAHVGEFSDAASVKYFVEMFDLDEVQHGMYKDTGVMLNVTPSVNAGDLVTLEIDQTVTDVGDKDKITGQRSFLQRQIASKVAVRSGETIVLGGLIKSKHTQGSAGLPVLSSIPLLGGLFGNQSREDVRTELLVIITPRVLRSDEDARAVSRELRDRMKGLSLPGHMANQ